MRLDKYLKSSRLIKRRTIATEACDAKRISVNGEPKKPSYTVKIGDVIEIRFGSNITKVSVISLTENPRKDDAVNMYEVLT